MRKSEYASVSGYFVLFNGLLCLQNNANKWPVTMGDRNTCVIQGKTSRDKGNCLTSQRLKIDAKLVLLQLSKASLSRVLFLQVTILEELQTKEERLSSLKRRRDQRPASLQTQTCHRILQN